MTDSDNDTFSINTSVCRFCDVLLVGKDASTAVLLDSISADLARDEGLRYVHAMHVIRRLIQDRIRMGTNNPSIWPSLHQAWDRLAGQVALDASDAPTRSLIMSIGKFTRNLVAAVPSNQQNAL